MHFNYFSGQATCSFAKWKAQFLGPVPRERSNWLSCHGMIFRLQDKNSLTLTGKSIFTLSPNSSTIMSHWFGKWHLEKSSFSRRMCPLSLLFFPLFLKRKLKCVCLKEMTVGSELLDLRCSKIPQCRASVASWISSPEILGLKNDKLIQVDCQIR